MKNIMIVTLSVLLLGPFAANAIKLLACQASQTTRQRRWNPVNPLRIPKMLWSHNSPRSLWLDTLAQSTSRRLRQADQAAALDTEIASLEGDCGTDCLKRAVKSGNATESIGEKLDAKTEIGATGKTNTH